MVTIYPGVAAAVEAVRAAGRRTGLVTSKNRQGALRGLTLVKLEQLMDVLVCADEVTNPKPHPEPVEKAMALLGRRPGHDGVRRRQHSRYAIRVARREFVLRRHSGVRSDAPTSKARRRISGSRRRPICSASAA